MGRGSHLLKYERIPRSGTWAYSVISLLAMCHGTYLPKYEWISVAILNAVAWPKETLFRIINKYILKLTCQVWDSAQCLLVFWSSLDLVYFNSSDAGDRIFINTMLPGALAPKVTRAWAGTSLVVLDRQRVLLLQSYFHLLESSQLNDNIPNVNIPFVTFKIKFSMSRLKMVWPSYTIQHQRPWSVLVQVIDLARNDNSGCANEILGCVKCHFWLKSPWKWKNLGDFRVCN